MGAIWEYLNKVAEDSFEDGPKGETLEEHRKHCDAKPGNCPFEKKLDRTDKVVPAGPKHHGSVASESEDAAYLDAVKRYGELLDEQSVDYERYDELASEIEKKTGEPYARIGMGDVSRFGNAEFTKLHRKLKSVSTSEMDELTSEYGSKIENDAVCYNAVKRVDMETCAKMVREAAAKAMPNTKVVDEDGEPMVVYHGTVGRDEDLFTEIREGMFSSNKDVAKYFDGTLTESPGRIYECMMDLRNPFVIDAEGASWNAIPIKKDVADALGIGWSSFAGQTERKKGNLLNCVYAASDDIVNAIRLQGNHDGVILKNVVETDQENVYSPADVVSFSPSKIKSADPVTYDDEENVIPLSKRFDMNNPDIRF